MKYLTILLFLAFAFNTNAQEVLKREYHENGLISLSVYRVAGQVHFVSYHENGKLFEKGTYQNGKKHGIWQRCDESGNTLTKGFYVDDRPEGRWVYRLCCGSNAWVKFKDGKVSSGEHLDELGEVIASR